MATEVKDKSHEYNRKNIIPSFEFHHCLGRKGRKSWAQATASDGGSFPRQPGSSYTFRERLNSLGIVFLREGKNGTKSLCSGVDLLKRTVNRLKDTVPSSGRVEDRLLSVMKLFNKRGFLNHAAILEVSWINLGFVIYGFFL